SSRPPAAPHTVAVPSEYPAARRAPSGDQATAQTLPACLLRVRSSRPLDTSHTLAVPSALPVASRFPSWDQETDPAHFECPWRVKSGVFSARSVEAARRGPGPPGEHRKPSVTAPRTGRGKSSRPLARSHTFADPSSLAVADRLPSGDQTTQRRHLVCALRV